MKVFKAQFLFFPFLLFGNSFPELPNTESTTDTDPPSAEESAKAFSLPEGTKVKVWAGEPMVQNPIAMAWDKHGRMWVAENYTYGSRKIRFDLSLRDRVIVLSDTDGDGQADTRKVFTDKVQMLTSVEVGQGGVWLMCPPKLLFIPDRDGDLVPDGEPEVMLDGFDVARGNYHNFANGLRWGPDGWLYGRCGHSCPEELECRAHLMNYVIRLTGDLALSSA
jgi:putative membrane-bound dehydrogenase-like protein